MSFDGVAEILATRDRLKANLVGGRVYLGLPDDEQLERDTNGIVKPYIVVYPTTPITGQTERQMGVGPERQPHILPLTIAAFASTETTALLTVAAIMKWTLGWAPGGDNSTPYEIPGGYSIAKMDAQKKPTRFEQGINLLSTINMQTD